MVLCHAAVRDAAAKGEIERFNRTLRMRFLSSLLASATESLAKWAAAYNAAVHSSTVPHRQADAPHAICNAGHLNGIV